MDGKHAIGVDLGGTKILAGVVTRAGEVVRQHERPTPQDSQKSVLRELGAAISEVLDDDVAAVGFGVPSPIDQPTGIVVECVNVKLVDCPLRDLMVERFGLPVGLDNDANAAAIGEWRAGAGRGVDDLVMLTLGTGVGGGVIHRGAPMRGARGGGMELGHVVVVHDGLPCGGACRGRGHLEAYLTGVAATARAKEAFGPDADARLLIHLADEGDEVARAIFADIGGVLGSGLGSFANIFEPDLLVIGGGFGVAAWAHIIPRAEEVMFRETLRPMRDRARVVEAELGTVAGLIGAGYVAFEALDAA